MSADSIFCDWKRNKRNIKGRLVTVLFRIATVPRKSRLLFYLFLPYLIFYRVAIEWLLNVELPWNTEIKPGLIIFHGHSLVVNSGTKVGSNCTLRQGVTIGNKQLRDGTISGAPIIGNNVDIGANSCIIGEIMIGDNVIIGAGSIVVKSIQSNCVVGGNPAKVIRQLRS